MTLSRIRRGAARAFDVAAILIVALLAYRLLVAPRSLSSSSASTPAPVVRLSRMGGGDVVVGRPHGRTLFVDFWASWCVPCKLSLPLVERFARAHPDVDVIAVDVGEPPAIAAAYASAHGIGNVAFDERQDAARAFGVVAFPTMVVVDGRGLERARWTGFNPAIAAIMENARTKLARAGAADSLRAAAAEPPRPLALGIEDDPSSLDTILNTPYGWQLAPLTQGYLFLVDDRGRLVPDRALAIPTRANGGISADGRTIVYRIRTGRWSDGAPFDARDVAFTVAALKNPRTNVPDRATADQIESVRVPRPDTLVVRLRHPSAPFVSSFLTLGASDPFAILPRHVVVRLPDLNRSTLDAHPVGLGPFRLLRWRRGERLEFVPNPYYWRPGPRLARVDVLVQPNPQTRLFMMQSGELDLTYLSGAGVAAAERARVPVVRATTNIVDYLAFNVRRAALAQRAVRVAIAEAIDRAQLARAVYRGLEAPTESGVLGLNAAVALPSNDPARAASVLRPRHLALELAIAGSWRSSADAAVQIAADLRRAGVVVEIHSYDPGTFWGPKSAGGVLENARFDLALTSWSPSLDRDRLYLFGCDAVPPNGGNAGGYCDRAYDRAEIAGMGTYDLGQRTRAYRRAAAILVRDLPVLPLGLERSAYAVSARFRGFRPNELGRDFWNAYDWSLAP